MLPGGSFPTNLFFEAKAVNADTAFAEHLAQHSQISRKHNQHES